MKGKFVLLIFVFLCLAGCSSHKWTKKDIAYEATYQVLHIVDWRQTLGITEKPDIYWEMNPILGEHPNRDTVNIYFLASGLGHIFITDLLPQPWRKRWLMFTGFVKIYCVENNFSIGLGCNF